MHIYSNLQEQNDLFYQEIKEFLDTKKIKGLIFDLTLKSMQESINLNLKPIEISEPVLKKKLEIEEKIDKPKTNERKLF